MTDSTATTTPRLMSARAYARLRGASQSTIRHAIQSGVIQLVDGQVDCEAADRSWGARRRAPYLGRDTDRNPGRASTVAKVRVAKAKLATVQDQLKRLHERYANRAEAIAQYKREGNFVLEELKAVPAALAGDIAAQLGIETEVAHALLTKFIEQCLDELGDLPKQLSEIARRA